MLLFLVKSKFGIKLEDEIVLKDGHGAEIDDEVLPIFWSSIQSLTSISWSKAKYLRRSRWTLHFALLLQLATVSYLNLLSFCFCSHHFFVSGPLNSPPVAVVQEPIGQIFEHLTDYYQQVAILI